MKNISILAWLVNNTLNYISDNISSKLKRFQASKTQYKLREVVMIMNLLFHKGLLDYKKLSNSVKKATLQWFKRSPTEYIRAKLYKYILLQFFSNHNSSRAYIYFSFPFCKIWCVFLIKIHLLIFIHSFIHIHSLFIWPVIRKYYNKWPVITKRLQKYLQQTFLE